MFLRVPFALFDTCLAGAVPPRVVVAYLILKAHVWRSTSKGIAELREACRNGELATLINHRNLAAALGSHRRQTAGKVLKELEQLGWIQTLPLGAGRPNIYLLGEVVTTEEGDLEEVYLLSQHLKDVLDRAPKGEKRVSRAEWLRFAEAHIGDAARARESGQGEVNGGANISPPKRHANADINKREEIGKSKVGSRERSRNGSSSPFTIELAIQEFEKARMLARKKWTVRALVGWYFVCQHVYRASASKVRCSSLLFSMRRRVRAEGIVVVAKVVEILFRSAWIRSDHQRFIIDKGKFYDHFGQWLDASDPTSEKKLKPKVEVTDGHLRALRLCLSMSTPNRVKQV